MVQLTRNTKTTKKVTDWLNLQHVPDAIPTIAEIPPIARGSGCIILHSTLNKGHDSSVSSRSSHHTNYSRETDEKPIEHSSDEINIEYAENIADATEKTGQINNQPLSHIENISPVQSPAALNNTKSPVRSPSVNSQKTPLHSPSVNSKKSSVQTTSINKESSTANLSPEKEKGKRKNLLNKTFSLEKSPEQLVKVSSLQNSTKITAHISIDHLDEDREEEDHDDFENSP